MSGPEIVHTYPTVGRTHNTSGLSCWCNPTYLTPCDECTGESDCWKCDGFGLLRIADPSEYDGPHGINVMHRGRED